MDIYAYENITEKLEELSNGIEEIKEKLGIVESGDNEEEIPEMDEEEEVRKMIEERKKKKSEQRHDVRNKEGKFIKGEDEDLAELEE